MQENTLMKKGRLQEKTLESHAKHVKQAAQTIDLDPVHVANVQLGYTKTKQDPTTVRTAQAAAMGFKLVQMAKGDA